MLSNIKIVDLADSTGAPKLKPIEMNIINKKFRTFITHNPFLIFNATDRVIMPIRAIIYSNIRFV